MSGSILGSPYFGELPFRLCVVQVVFRDICADPKSMSPPPARDLCCPLYCCQCCFEARIKPSFSASKWTGCSGKTEKETCSLEPSPSHKFQSKAIASPACTKNKQATGAGQRCFEQSSPTPLAVVFQLLSRSMVWACTLRDVGIMMFTIAGKSTAQD